MVEWITKQLKSPIGIILGSALIVVAGVLLVVALLSPGQASTGAELAPKESPIAEESDSPTAAPGGTSTADPSPTSAPPAATVNGYAITQSYLSQTVKLNTVLGALSGADVLGKRETLDRLVRSQLILQGVDAIDEPSQEDVEAFISGLEENWGVSDETVNEQLEEAGVDRAFLEDTIKRLLTVQAGVESLEAEGTDIATWLREQEEDADIKMHEDLVNAEDVEPTAEATTEPTEEPEPTESAAAPAPEVVSVAPGFTLDQAGGGAFALEDQLEESSVVLVFFEKCG